MRVITFGEIMLRLSPTGNYRFLQAESFGATFGGVLFTTCTAIIGMTGISGAMIGQFYCKANVFERLLLLAGGLCLIDPHTLTDIIGVAILAGVFALQYFRSKKAKAAEA